MTDHNTMTNRDEQWAADFVNQERRRNAMIGIAVFAAIALFTVAIIAYFSGAAAIAW